MVASFFVGIAIGAVLRLIFILVKCLKRTNYYAEQGNMDKKEESLVKGAEPELFDYEYELEPVRTFEVLTALNNRLSDLDRDFQVLREFMWQHLHGAPRASKVQKLKHVWDQNLGTYVGVYNGKRLIR